MQKKEYQTAKDFLQKLLPEAGNVEEAPSDINTRDLTHLQNTIDRLLNDKYGDNPDSQLKGLKDVCVLLAGRLSQVQQEFNATSNSYEEVLGLVTHEFKNLLSTIQGYNRILRKHFIQTENKELQQVLGSSERINQRLFNIVESLLRMSMSDRRLLRPDYKLIDLEADILIPLEQELEGALIQADMQVVRKRKTRRKMVMADAEMLEIAVRNLLENAIKYGRKKSDIVVTIASKNEHLSCAVRNAGDGLSKERRIEIFEKFKSFPVGDVEQGTGIGLYNVKNIVNVHNGTVECRSKSGMWVEFEFSIPQNLE